jgi:hypothetical protein
MVVAETQPVAGAGPEALEEHVGFLCHPQHEAPTGVLLEVDDDRATRPMKWICAGATGAHAAVVREVLEAGAPPRVGRWLDGDDVRPEVAEQHRRGRPGRERGQV